MSLFKHLSKIANGCIVKGVKCIFPKKKKIKDMKVGINAVTENKN